MDRWVIEPSEYSRMVEELSKLNISADELDECATIHLSKDVVPEECYQKAFDELLEKSKEK